MQIKLAVYIKLVVGIEDQGVLYPPATHPLMLSEINFTEAGVSGGGALTLLHTS